MRCGGGDVVSEHTVYFYGAGERVEVTHRATNRAVYGNGALRAAKWAFKRQQDGDSPGMFSMRDVLSI